MLDGVGATAEHEPGAGHLQLVQEVAGLWFAMQSRLQTHFAELAAEQSLSAIQAKVLVQLDPAGAVTTRALADRLQYDPSNLTTVIDRLEALGVVLTERGQALRDAFWRRLVGVAGPLGQLSEGELAQLRAILRSALAEPPT